MLRFTEGKSLAGKPECNSELRIARLRVWFYDFLLQHAALIRARTVARRAVRRQRGLPEPSGERQSAAGGGGELRDPEGSHFETINLVAKCKAVPCHLRPARAFYCRRGLFL